MTLLRLLAVLMIFTAPAFAEEKADAPKPEEAIQEAPADTGREPTSESAKRMYKSISKFALNLKPPEMQHFYLTYNNYNLIRTVDVVREDVGNAVKACGENNPEIKDKIEKRFGKWSEALKPVYEEAEAHLDNMIIAQEYAKPEEIKKILDQVDETREESQRRFEKIPVTTPEACEYMLAKMDETQETMLSLLRATLVSYPQSLPGYVPEKTKEQDG